MTPILSEAAVRLYEQDRRVVPINRSSSSELAHYRDVPERYEGREGHPSTGLACRKSHPPFTGIFAPALRCHERAASAFRAVPFTGAGRVRQSL